MNSNTHIIPENSKMFNLDFKFFIDFISSESTNEIDEEQVQDEHDGNEEEDESECDDDVVQDQVHPF